MRELVIKNCGLRGMKGSTYTKKIRPTGSILIDFQDDSVIWKNCLKTLFYNIVVTLSPTFLGPEGKLE